MAFRIALLVQTLATTTLFENIFLAHYFRFYMENKGWWDTEKEDDWKRESRRQVMQAFARAENITKPPIKELFHDVYDEMPTRLQEQFDECMTHIEKYPNEYPTELYKKDD